MKIEEFINLGQGSMNVEEYSLNFTQFSKYVLSLMPNPRDDIKSVVWRCSMMI